MTVAACLRSARERLRTGWREPFSVDERGAAGASSKTAEKASVSDALAWSSTSVDEALEAGALLEAVACPNRVALDAEFMRPAPNLAALQQYATKYDGDLQSWLERKFRTHAQVLELFDRALVRTLKTKR